MMLKTIKKNVQMRLDELIKYVWEDDGSLFEEQATITFFTEDNKKVIFNDTGYFESLNWFEPEDLFPVEIEEEITEDTKFYGIQEVYLDIDEQEIVVENLLEEQTILDVLVDHDDSSKCLQIYAMIDEKKELIWEAQDNERKQKTTVF